MNVQYSNNFCLLKGDFLRTHHVNIAGCSIFQEWMSTVLLSDSTLVLFFPQTSIYISVGAIHISPDKTSTTTATRKNLTY